jgi:glutaredoxin
MVSKRYFIVHGRTSCPYCVSAVGLLESKNISYVFSPGDDSVLSEVKQRWDHKTVPMVIERDLYDNNHESFIGGYDDLCAYLAPPLSDGGTGGLDSSGD